MLTVLDEENEEAEFGDETNLDEDTVVSAIENSSLPTKYTTNMGVLVDDFLEGVNLQTLAHRFALFRKGDLITDLNVLMHYKFMDDIDDNIVLEVDNPHLPTQASVVVSSASDPLWKMQDISHNLPSRIPLLKKHKIEKSFIDETHNTHVNLATLTDGASDPVCYLYINGRAMNVTSPDFTMFNLLKKLRDEDERLQILNEKLNVLPPIVKQEVIDELEGEEDFLIGYGMNWGDDFVPRRSDEDDLPYRFDVARGGKKGLISCNNIEKDERYADWSTSTTDLFNEVMANDPGMTEARRQGPPDRGPTTIRRNALNFLLVVDPLSINPATFNSFSFGFVKQLMSDEYPARLQVLFATEDDLDNYAREGDNWKLNQTGNFCTGADVMALFMKVLKTYDHFRAMQFLGIWSSNIINFRNKYPTVPVVSECAIAHL